MSERSIDEQRRRSSADRRLLRDLLDRPLPAALTTLDPDGSPRSVLVWCDRERDRITVNAKERIWLRNLRRDPRLALLVHDNENILRYVAVRGRASRIEADPDYAHVDRLSRKYEGRRFQYSTPEEVERFKVTIEVEGLRTLDASAPLTTIR